jgi:hypothetical protein
MNNKVLSIGLMLAVLISFSGFSFATTISNTGSNVHYNSSSLRYANNWYISTSTHKTSSTIVFKVKVQKLTSNVWITGSNFKFTIKFLKISKTKIKMTFKSYKNGKLLSTKSSYIKNPKMHTPRWWAKAMLPIFLKGWKTTI